MTPDPYNDDDDDQPTLQRHAPACSAAPRQNGVPARFASGTRVACRLPEEADASDAAPFLEGGFEEEADTAVDRKPLSALPAEDSTTATALPDDLAATAIATALPADGERDTATLPIDVAAVLRLASIQPDDAT